MALFLKLLLIDMEKMVSEEISALTLLTAISNNRRIKCRKKTKKNWLMNKTFVGMEESAGAVIQRCSVNKFFWKILQNLQENTCTGISRLQFY